MAKDINLSEVGLTIRKLRISKGIKQYTIAKKIGITSVGYGKIERGESNITLERLCQISEALNASPFDFLLPNNYFENSIKEIINNELGLLHINNKVIKSKNPNQKISIVLQLCEIQKNILLSLLDENQQQLE